MSATFDFVTVADSVSKLSISGVVMRDLDQNNSVQTMTPGSFFPRFDDPVTDMEIIRDEVSGQLLTVWYTGHWQYIHCAIGGNIDQSVAYAAMVAKVALIIVALSDNATLAGSMDHTSPKVDFIGTMKDGAGNQYLGSDVSFRIMQFLEV
jgi:hypothetical protein